MRDDELPEIFVWAFCPSQFWQLIPEYEAGHLLLVSLPEVQEAEDDRLPELLEKTWQRDHYGERLTIFGSDPFMLETPVVQNEAALLATDFYALQPPIFLDNEIPDTPHRSRGTKRSLGKHHRSQRVRSARRKARRRH